MKTDFETYERTFPLRDIWNLSGALEEGNIVAQAGLFASEVYYRTGACLSRSAQGLLSCLSPISSNEKRLQMAQDLLKSSPVYQLPSRPMSQREGLPLNLVGGSENEAVQLSRSSRGIIVRFDLHLRHGSFLVNADGSVSDFRSARYRQTYSIASERAMHRFVDALLRTVSRKGQARD